MGNSTSSVDYELDKSEEQKCEVLYSSNASTSVDDSTILCGIEFEGPIISNNKKWIKAITKTMDGLNISIMHSEVVFHIKLKKKHRSVSKKKEDGSTNKLAYKTSIQVSSDDMPLDHLIRKLKNSLLTLGSISLCRQPNLWSSKWKENMGIVVPIRQIRSLRFDGNRQLVTLVFDHDVDEVQATAGKQGAIAYQTPFPDRLLSKLMEVIVTSYAGTPEWAIPLKLNLSYLSSSSSLSIKPNVYKNALSNDGGFESGFYSYLVGHIISKMGKHTKNTQNWNDIVKYQQQKGHTINLNQLVSESLSEIIGDLTCISDALSLLPFNLHYRTLKLNDLDPTHTGKKRTKKHIKERFEQSLTSVLYFNVTLCELDFSGTNLKGLGGQMGQALAMNIQPLISRLRLSRCNLCDDDMKGLTPGLARIWCGGSAFPEILDFSNNLNVTTQAWNRLFQIIMCPSVFKYWPKKKAPPPPAPLMYLQHLDVSYTSAPSAVLADFVSHLSGLKFFAIGGGTVTNMNDVSLVLNSLLLENALLEGSNNKSKLDTFHGYDLHAKEVSPVLHSHASTIRTIKLWNLRGNVYPLLFEWPNSVPNLSIELLGSVRNAVCTLPPPSTTAATVTTTSSPSNIDLITGYYCPRAVKVEQAWASQSFVLPEITLSSSIVASIPESQLNAHAVGLQNLHLEDVYYIDLNASLLATCSQLKSLFVSINPKRKKNFNMAKSEIFWNNLSVCKSLENLHLPHQITYSCEVSMIGNFLRKNRSVRFIDFDGSFILQANDAKALRGAFYGNKKMIDMKFPALAKDATIRHCQRETQQALNDVNNDKMEIKRIFKSHYSKYNYRWRDVPNQLKLPYVENIRQNKRKISQLNRDQQKIGQALDEVGTSLRKNETQHIQIQKEKTDIKLEKRSHQFNNLAEKRKKNATKLIQKLHKAKAKGRKNKGAKKQIPRASYYRSPNEWGVWNGSTTNSNNSKNIVNPGIPTQKIDGVSSTKKKDTVVNNENKTTKKSEKATAVTKNTTDGNVEKEEITAPTGKPTGNKFWGGWMSRPGYHYHYYPYYHYPYGFNDPYGTRYYHNNYRYDDFDEEEPIEEPPVDGDGEGEDVDETGEENDGEIGEELPPEEVEPIEGIDETDATWDSLLSESGENFANTAALDPWENMDQLLAENVNNPEDLLSPEILSEIHMEAAELGPDVVADIAQVIDDSALIDDKIGNIADSMDVDPDLIEDQVQAAFEDLDFNAEEIYSELPEIDDYEAEDDFDGDVVEMYAGAGPRDLEDGGPNFGKNDAVPSMDKLIISYSSSTGEYQSYRYTEEYRLHEKEVKRNDWKLRRVRSNLLLKMQQQHTGGYKHFHLENNSSSPSEMNHFYHKNKALATGWPTNTLKTWKHDISNVQINAVANCDDICVIPHQISGIMEPERIMDWSSSSYLNNPSSDSLNEMNVTLVTQCSLDRLDNLQNQLGMWGGKASVAIYVRPSECSSTDIANKDVKNKILDCLESARLKAASSSSSSSSSKDWDVAVNLVLGVSDDEPYPINYLRNVALLEAKYQQQKRKAYYAAGGAAVLLVDVDFSPCENLHRVLNSSSLAFEHIITKRQVVVCPAFEDLGPTIPKTIAELKTHVDNGKAEGFHQSHFPQGHGCTSFKDYWELSSDFLASSATINDDNVELPWKKSYSVKYEDNFEPYIVMATEDVPLYDERFVGYGLNKVSHLLSVSVSSASEFLVLPGIFLVAPIHQRSKDWSQIYGSGSNNSNDNNVDINDSKNFNKLWLKGLYREFSLRMKEGKDPIVSEWTMKRQKELLLSTPVVHVGKTLESITRDDNDVMMSTQSDDDENCNTHYYSHTIPNSNLNILALA